MEFLVELGADPEKTNIHGKSAAELLEKTNKSILRRKSNNQYRDKFLNKDKVIEASMASILTS